MRKQRHMVPRLRLAILCCAVPPLSRTLDGFGKVKTCHSFYLINHLLLLARGFLAHDDTMVSLECVPLEISAS